MAETGVPGLGAANRIRPSRRLAVVLGALLVTASAVGGGAQSDPTDVAPWEDILGPFAGLVGLGPDDSPLPSDPQAALVDEVNAFLTALGFEHDATSEILSAGVADDLAGRTAQALAALHGCFDATTAAIGTMGLEAIVDAARNDPGALAPADLPALQDCVMPAAQAIVNLESVASLQPTSTAAAPSNLVNVWPVLVIDTGGDDTYENDYILVVETGGNDVHDNNAGSNMIDTRFAPASSPFPGIDTVPDDGRQGFGPSEGCAIALGSLLAGNCTPVVAALIDTQGSDTYGVFKEPVGGVDGRCTTDPVIRRMVTNGVGFLGFGMLLDSQGADRFNGRTGSNGAGHIFGVGVLQDRQGNDNYLDVRNAQGFSLIANLGLLLDEGGRDRYDRYMPTAKIPGTPNEQEGAGGVIDDENKCDIIPRLLQGAGNAVGVGVLIDLDGRDTYVGACTDDFGAPGDIGAPACSQGFGATGGIGALFDEGDDRDSYSGVPDRFNDFTLLRVEPSADVDATDPTAPVVERSLSIEMFSDT